MAMMEVRVASFFRGTYAAAAMDLPICCTRRNVVSFTRCSSCDRVGCLSSGGFELSRFIWYVVTGPSALPSPAEPPPPPPVVSTGEDDFGVLPKCGK
jgi:hypothetical protein